MKRSPKSETKPKSEGKPDVNGEENANAEGTEEENEGTGDDTITELPDPKWEKVGQIQELYVYPLKSGRGKSLRECDFTEWGISFENAGKFKLRDR